MAKEFKYCLLLAIWDEKSILILWGTGEGWGVASKCSVCYTQVTTISVGLLYTFIDLSVIT